MFCVVVVFCLSVDEKTQESFWPIYFSFCEDFGVQYKIMLPIFNEKHHPVGS